VDVELPVLLRRNLVHSQGFWLLGGVSESNE
jgi:hypothetical protein